MLFIQLHIKIEIELDKESKEKVVHGKFDGLLIRLRSLSICTQQQNNLGVKKESLVKMWGHVERILFFILD